MWIQLIWIWWIGKIGRIRWIGWIEWIVWWNLDWSAAGECGPSGEPERRHLLWQQEEGSRPSAHLHGNRWVTSSLLNSMTSSMHFGGVEKYSKWSHYQTIKKIKIANFMTIAIVHIPHSYNLSWEFIFGKSISTSLSCDHLLITSIMIVWVETRKQKNNKSINIPWVQNVIYVVNNPKIPFVHSRGQVKWKESRMTVFTLTDAMWTKVQRNCFLQPSHPSALRACLIPAKIKTVFNIKCSGKFLHFHITVTARDID